MTLTFLNNYAPVWIFVVLAVVFYAGLKAIKISDKDWILILTSLVLSFLVVGSKSATRYLIDLTPYILLITVAIFFVLLAIFLVGGKDMDMMKRILAWAGLAVAVVLVIGLAFHNFNALNHMLPDSSDSGLSSEMEDFKDWIYSDDVKESAVFLVAIALVCVFLLKK